MKFTPKSEEEVATANLLPAGDYPFEVLEAEDKTSKAGNDMIALKLGIETETGMRGVFDYLLEAIEYKLRHFFDTVGMLAEYEKGQISADGLVGATGMARIIIQPAKDGYDAKNAVKDYIKRGAGAATAQPKARVKDDPMDSEIPW